MMLQIKFLDKNHAPIDVEIRPSIQYDPHWQCGDTYEVCDIAVGWGDRKVSPEGEMLPPRVYKTREWAEVTGQTVDDAELARVQEVVDRLWRETPTVAPACESYRRIVAGIIKEQARSAENWCVAAREIARTLRRKRVSLGEQTVPGKVCVRSTRGKLLGYALMENYQWTGKIERV